ncbi:MAG: Haloalkane dehalogenase 2 [Candidatus Marinimicrobia bacterium]|nr:Haloalkane dehalogenase 2 [Candidatus Neomarinimicrobiota bacterium]
MSGFPEWLDRTEYPFELRKFSSAAGTLNYVDEGTGPTVIFLHGNPTWSFLYRSVIKGLSSDFRCIAPDYLGFGLSDAPEVFSYSPDDHSAVIAEFIESIDADIITLVLHDWGGPIGLKYAIKNPSQIKKIVLFNTWMWPVKQSPKFWLFSILLGNRSQLPFYRRQNIFARYIMPLGLSHPWEISEIIHSQYIQPLQSHTSRYATWMFPRSLLRSIDMLEHLWGARERISKIPKLLVWGMKDRMFDGRVLDIWIHTFPDATTEPVYNAGHYVPEELGNRYIKIIAQFLDS